MDSLWLILEIGPQRLRIKGHKGHKGQAWKSWGFGKFAWISISAAGSGEVLLLFGLSFGRKTKIPLLIDPYVAHLTTLSRSFAALALLSMWNSTSIMHDAQVLWPQHPAQYTWMAISHAKALINIGFYGIESPLATPPNTCWAREPEDLVQQ